MRRFRVDDVVPASEPLPARPLGARLAGAHVIGGDPSTPVIDHHTTHPLLAAVGIAFAQHRPLVLSPDAVWLTIAQGVAQHVRLHAEALRPRLVRHDGHKRLAITRTAVPTDAGGWAAAVADLRHLLAVEIGDGRARLFECDFSTSTDVDRLASQIVLLDAYAPYFSYWMDGVCGIPEVTLLGTVDDWRKIRARVDVIAELDLARWSRSLAPITDQLVRTAAGDVDVAFWRRIYNPIDAYGGQLITGWITRLYPYVEAGGTVGCPNPMLDLPLDEPKQRTTAANQPYDGPGVRSDAIPATVSRVKVHIVDQAARERRTVALVAGVTAVAQDPDGGLRPICGWHVEDAPVRIGKLVDRLCAEHEVVRPDPRAQRHVLTGAAEVIELFGQIESATLFTDERAWRLRSPRTHHWVELERGGQFSIHRIVDLPNAKSLCAATHRRTGETSWIECRLKEQPMPHDIALVPGTATALDAPHDIRVFGTSLAAILDAALATGGEIDHLQTGTFDELLLT